MTPLWRRGWIDLPRRLLAEGIGTALLVTVVVGSGIAAARLSPTDMRLQLLENSTATVLGLAVLILMFGPVSGAHSNPVVTIADWVLGRGRDTGVPGAMVVPYLAAQIVGGIAGAILANVMFDLRAVQISTTDRATTGHGVGGIVATAGLIALIFLLARTGRQALSAAAVGAYIGAAYWFTSSTSFANPAVTIGRIFSDTFAGIAPSSVPLYLGAQIIGAGLGVGLVLVLVPEPPGRPRRRASDHRRHPGGPALRDPPGRRPPHGCCRPGPGRKASAAISSGTGVSAVRELRIRWIGHTLRAEVDLTVDPTLTVEQAHDLAHHAEAHLLADVSRLTAATIHVSPTTAHPPLTGATRT